jgi:hypothetical protein
MYDATGKLIPEPESEFKPLLDRELVTTDVKQHLGPWCAIIHDLINYGTNLIPRAFSSSEKGLLDVVLIPILLRQVVAMLDGTDVLLTTGAVHAANLQLRALLEASVYIDWIIQADSERKATYYFVHNLRRKRAWALRTSKTSTEYQAFESAVGKSLPVSDELSDASTRDLKEYDRVLSEPRFASVSAEFDQARGKRAQDPAWYVPLGTKSVFQVANEVGRASQYLIFYSMSSDVMHASNFDSHVTFEKSKITFEPIRSLEGWVTIFSFNTSMALHTFRSILSRYREGELESFSRKYVAKWQKYYMNPPQIKIKHDLTQI